MQSNSTWAGYAGTRREAPRRAAFFSATDFQTQEILNERKLGLIVAVGAPTNVNIVGIVGIGLLCSDRANNKREQYQRRKHQRSDLG